MRLKRRLIVFVGVPLMAAITVVVGRSAWLWSATRIPTLECPETIEFGERDRGEIVHCQIPVRNSGRALLVLDNFETSCSCAGVERVIDGRLVRVRSLELEPNEGQELTARMAIGAPQGEPQVVSVYFRTNDPARPVQQVQLVVSRVRGGVYALPKAVVFGPLRVGEQVVRIIDLYDTGLTGRKVAAARSKQPERFTVRFVPLGPGEAPVANPSAGKLIGRLEVTAHTERPGSLDGDIEITLANEQRPPDLLPVVGDTVPSILCRPQQLFLPRRVAEKYVYDGEVCLASSAGKPIQVTVDSVSPGISASVKEVPGQAAQALLMVKLDPDTAPMSHGRVRIRIRGDGSEVVEDLPIVIGEVPP